MKRTVIYTRTATECNQDELDAHTEQAAVCQEDASRQADEQVIAVVSDTGSGVTLNRPGLNRIRAMIQRQEVDVVRVSNLDRLSRNLSQQVVILDECRAAGIRVFCPGQEAPLPLLDAFMKAIVDWEGERRADCLKLGREMARRASEAGQSQ